MADGAKRNEPERNTLAGRLKRYANVTTSVGGAAARIAGSRAFRTGSDEKAQAADLKAALGGVKGPIMKVAQMLASIPEALPASFAAELATLQTNAPPMGWPFVKRRMSVELGPAWEAKFRSFERDAAAAASLGQVHRAVSKSGEELACKL